MRPSLRRLLCLAAAVSTAAALSACGGSRPGSGQGGSRAPIVIGASLSLTGGFAADGSAFQRGYQLWASVVNKHGGLLGRPVRLTILNDASSPTQAAANYAKLIITRHADLVFGPFSTLLTVPSAKVAARHGYALIEAAGGGAAVFQLGLRNLFSVSPPVADQLVPFARWVASLPASQRPATAAYPMVDDPFADPMVATARDILQGAGIKTVYSHIFPAGSASYQAGAAAVAASKAQLVVLGSVDVPTVASFLTGFEHHGYNPRILAASAGPDQGSAFLKAIGGSKNASGIFVPNGWYGGDRNPLSQAMVKAYLVQYGGTASGINADVAEAYSVGESAADAVMATHSLSNATLISWLHSHTFQTVQGTARFNGVGENLGSNVFIFQWQHGARFVQVLPAGQPGSVSIVTVRPPWGHG